MTIFDSMSLYDLREEVSRIEFGPDIGDPGSALRQMVWTTLSYRGTSTLAEIIREAIESAQFEESLCIFGKTHRFGVPIAQTG